MKPSPFASLTLILILPFVDSSSVNCTFDAECCWSSQKGQNPWIINNEKMAKEDFRKTFRAERNRTPPKGSYLSLSVSPKESDSAEWTSCPICSENGLCEVKLRLWQSPTARVNLCWRAVEGGESKANCASLNSRKEHPASLFFTLPRKREVQFYLSLTNRGTRSKATAVVDSIQVLTQFCSQAEPQPQSQTESQPQPQPQSQPQPSVSNSTVVAHAVPIAQSPSAFNEIFGDDFAEFLSNENSSKYENAEISGSTEIIDEGPSPRTLEAGSAPERTTLSTSGSVASPSGTTNPSVGVPMNLLSCDTPGGCLFDNSMCAYANSLLSDKATFQRTSISDNHFVQAVVPPGGVAILEADTEFKEDHRVFFDFLEYSDGEKLSACCFKPQQLPQELFCPYTTESQETFVLWRSANILCPAGTTKLMFICENYGRGNGTCSMDNVRLHKSMDILQLEPCQKSVLHSL